MTARLLTAADVAEFLNVPESWVRQETRVGRLPAIPLGRYWRYDEADVRAWVASLKKGGGAPAVYRTHTPTLARDRAGGVT